MSRWNPRYELIKLGVKYDLALVSKMGYHKVNGVWIKKNQPAEASQEQPTEAAPSGPFLEDVMTALGQLQMQMHQRFDLVDQRFQGFHDQLNLMELRLDAYNFQPFFAPTPPPSQPSPLPVLEDVSTPTPFAEDVSAVPDVPPA